MIYSFEILLLILLLATAARAIMVKDLISSVFILGCYRFLLALVWAWLGAVEWLLWKPSWEPAWRRCSSD